MKKTISLILTLILCLSLCACGNKSEETKSDEIALTLENYANYLSISASMYEPSSSDGTFVGGLNGGNGIAYDGGGTYYLYKYFLHNTEIEGVSSNFNYNDVKVTIKYTGTYKTVDIKTGSWDDGNEINQEVAVTCNIAGEGSVLDKFHGNGGYMLRKMADVDWEVVAISGTVSPC